VCACACACARACMPVRVRAVRVRVRPTSRIHFGRPSRVSFVGTCTGNSRRRPQDPFWQALSDMVSQDPFGKSLSGVVSGAHVRIHFGRLSRARPIGHMLDEFLWAPAGSILVSSLGLVSWAHVQGILEGAHRIHFGRLSRVWPLGHMCGGFSRAPAGSIWQALLGLVSQAHVWGFFRR
jgi:hypothetical protein